MHERPASLALYVRQCGHRPVNLTHEVHIDYALELFWLGLVEGCEETDGREVYPGVEPTVLLNGNLGDGLYLLELADVGYHGPRRRVSLGRPPTSAVPPRSWQRSPPWHPSPRNGGPSRGLYRLRHPSPRLPGSRSVSGPHRSFPVRSANTKIYVPVPSTCKRQPLSCRGSIQSHLEGPSSGGHSSAREKVSCKP